jgi:hypothetical protein
MQFNPSPYSYGEVSGEDEYGFLIAGPVIAYKAYKAVTDEDSEFGQSAELLKDYWWVGLLAVPVAFVGINRLFDLFRKVEERKEKK